MQYLFRNRYAALVWVALSLFSAAYFVGDGGGHEQVEDAAARLRAQQAEIAAVEASGAADTEPAEEETAPDKELTAQAGEDGVFIGPDGKRYKVVTKEEAARLAESGEGEGGE